MYSISGKLKLNLDSLYVHVRYEFRLSLTFPLILTTLATPQ